MYEHNKLMQHAVDIETMNTLNQLEISQKYFEGLDIIKEAIKNCFYLETDDDFYKILKDILGPLSVVNKETYCRPLTERDVILGRPFRTIEEFNEYHVQLEINTRKP